jgi:hypothetical protein
MTITIDGTAGISGFSGPTQTILTSGSGTYNTPANVKWLRVRMVGSGGGGGGGGSSAQTNGVSGSASLFGTSLLVANGGGYGGASAAGPGGGSYSISSPATGFGFSGGTGGLNVGLGNMIGLYGGTNVFGGAGYGGAASGSGGNAVPGTGAGGGGAGDGSAGYSAGAGSAGGYVEAIITNPSATYSYTVGVGGAGGSGAYTGGNGASGIIIIEEHYSL